YLKFTNLHLRWYQLPSPTSWVRSNDERIKSYVETKDKKEAISDKALEPLSSVFESFDVNFRRQDQLADANEAYYQARLAELQEASEIGWSWNWIVKEGLPWLFWGLPCGYGTNFGRVVYLVIGVNLIFTLLYYTRAELSQYDSPEGKQDFTFKPRLLDMPWDYMGKNTFPEGTPRTAGGEDHVVPTM